MNKLSFLSSFFCLSCFAYSPQMEKQRDDIWELHLQGNTDTAVDITEKLIKTVNVPEVDKVHFYVLLGELHFSLGLIDEYSNDVKLLNKLIYNNSDCRDEYWEYYDLNYTTPALRSPFPSCKDFE